MRTRSIRKIARTGRSGPWGVIFLCLSGIAIHSAHGVLRRIMHWQPARNAETASAGRLRISATTLQSVERLLTDSCGALLRELHAKNFMRNLIAAARHRFQGQPQLSIPAIEPCGSHVLDALRNAGIFHFYIASGKERPTAGEDLPMSSRDIMAGAPSSLGEELIRIHSMLLE